MSEKYTPAMAQNILMKNVEELTPYAKNARTHSEEQTAQIANSIIEFGFTNPILIDGKKGIIAGHGRLMAAQKLGMKEVPVVVLDHLSPEQKKAYIIADNKLAELAGWDEDLLAQELAALKDADYNIDLIGFSDQEIENLFSSLYEEDDEKENAVPDIEEKAISKMGDIWLLGKHKLICGDACQADTLKSLLGEELVDMTFTDPPYNVDYGNTPKDKVRAKAGAKGGRKIMNDNLGASFEKFLFDACKNFIAVTKGAIYICMSSSELHTLQKSFADAGGHWSTFIIWAKNTFTLGRADYQRQYECILYGWKKGNDRYWCGARNQGDVWFYNKPNRNDLHPTMKPVELCERAVLNSTKTDDLVLDAFGGSGTTLIACEKLNRRCRAIELDPKYVDVIIRRWQDYADDKAKHAITGKLFDDLKVEEKEFDAETGQDDKGTR
ncbi:MAG: site-specific DNA-methyltransferase [Alphaproteobacteria bacterium]